MTFNASTNSADTSLFPADGEFSAGNIPNPKEATLSDVFVGVSDVSISNGVYKFLGCSITSVDLDLGYNSQASSATVRLVEDVENGDSFQEPTIPSVHAISLPKGGVGETIFKDDTFDFDPNGLEPTNVPFYFAGIVTNWSRDEINIDGQTIEVQISDVREILGGVQCLLSGFSLSFNVGTGGPRIENVNNIIDVFGFFNYGLTSNRNEFGLQWNKVRQAIESSRISIHDVEIEFNFTGDAFVSTPNWYRIGSNNTDLMSLIEKVSDDGGADFFIIGRKMNSQLVKVEIKSIPRQKDNELAKSEIDDFINNRSSIVLSANKGREYRNEPTSSVILGGKKNKNYVAYSSSYNQNLKITQEDGENVLDYSIFPSDIKDRLFDSEDGTNTGAIFPFWGFDPQTSQPLAEPFLYLDHLSLGFGNLPFSDNIKGRIPLCDIQTKSVTVRQVNHEDVFLDGDGSFDARPWAYLNEYRIQDTGINGWVRGLPLNTEVLRAALQSKEKFFLVYRLYFPDAADSLYFYDIDWERLFDISGQNPLDNWWEDVNFGELIDFDPPLPPSINIDSDNEEGIRQVKSILEDLRTKIWEYVKQYAEEHMGKKWIVALPRSIIMDRIDASAEVPTRINEPKIEYNVVDRAYWETIPDEFDGVVPEEDTNIYEVINGNSTTVNDEELQIIRRFMHEDGRFSAMAFMEYKPQGNASFNSDGTTSVLFSDLPVSDFRPNNLISSVPDRVAIAADVEQLTKRPDMALVSIPDAVRFNNGNQADFAYQDENGSNVDPQTINEKNVIEFFLQAWANNVSAGFGVTIKDIFANKAELKKAAASFADEIINFVSSPQGWGIATDRNMDLAAITIPLESNWVSYGPWFFTTDDANGMVDVQVDRELVPWNFSRPLDDENWDKNLNEAGFERLNRTLSDITYLDSASIVVAGFPEFGIGRKFGFNSNIASISTTFDTDGIQTTYSLSTFSALPGTYRKSEYDNLSKIRSRVAADFFEKGDFDPPDLERLPLASQFFIGR